MNSSKFTFLFTRTLLSVIIIPSLMSSQNIDRYLHAIVINQRGYVINPNGDGTEMLSSRNNDKKYREQVSAIMTNLRKKIIEEKVTKVLLTIHGGMISVKKGRDKIDKQGLKMINDGYYPLFINWDAAPLSSYWQHLTKIRSGEELRKMGYFTFPFYFVAGLGKGIVKYPPNLIERFFLIARNNHVLNNSLKSADTIHSILKNKSNSIHLVGNSQDDSRTGAQKAWKGFRYNVNELTGLVCSPLIFPFLDGAGTPTWNIMLRRAQLLFKNSDQFDIRGLNKRDQLEASLDIPNSGPLGILVDSLKPLLEKYPKVKLTLIGHSMGTIIINEALRVYGNEFKSRITDIVFMAAACSIKDWETSVLSYMKQNDTVNFYNLVLNPFAEVRELSFPILPPGSLLEWIDLYFGSANAFTERTMGKYTNFMQAVSIIPLDLRNRVTLKTFGYGDDEDVVTHGSFSGQNYWLPQFWSGEDGIHLREKKLLK